MEENDNVYKFGVVDNTKTGDEDLPPMRDYVIVDIDNEPWFASGYMLFTSFAVAIVDADHIPVLCIPINRVKGSQLFDDWEDQSADDADPPDTGLHLVP